MMKKLRALVLVPLFLSLSACIGTVVGAVVDTTIEIVKIPFKVVGAAVDVVTPDDLSDLSPTDAGFDEELNAEEAAVKMENSEFK